MKNQRGLTLIEVLGSLVIISIVLFSFFQLIINSSSSATRNNEKLVMIYLAEAELERLKLNPFENLPFIEGDSLYKTNHSHEVTLNGQKYKITIKTFQDTREQELKLFNAIVQVTSISNNTSSSIEGYVIYE